MITAVLIVLSTFFLCWGFAWVAKKLGWKRRRIGWVLLGCIVYACLTAKAKAVFTAPLNQVLPHDDAVNGARFRAYFHHAGASTITVNFSVPDTYAKAKASGANIATGYVVGNPATQSYTFTAGQTRLIQFGLKTVGTTTNSNPSKMELGGKYQVVGVGGWKDWAGEYMTTAGQLSIQSGNTVYWGDGIGYSNFTIEISTASSNGSLSITNNALTAQSIRPRSSTNVWLAAARNFSSGETFTYSITPEVWTPVIGDAVFALKDETQVVGSSQVTLGGASYAWTAAISTGINSNGMGVCQLNIFDQAGNGGTATCTVDGAVVGTFAFTPDTGALRAEHTPKYDKAYSWTVNGVVVASGKTPKELDPDLENDGYVIVDFYHLSPEDELPINDPDNPDYDPDKPTLPDVPDAGTDPEKFDMYEAVRRGVRDALQDPQAVSPANDTELPDITKEKIQGAQMANMTSTAREFMGDMLNFQLGDASPIGSLMILPITADIVLDLTPFSSMCIWIRQLALAFLNVWGFIATMNVLRKMFI